MKGKDQAKETAHQLFLDGKHTSKEIAALLNISERTISKWVQAGKWKEERAMRNVTPRELEADIMEIISELITQRKTCVDPKERISIADQISKYNKLLETMRKETRLALHVYVTVLDELLAFQNTRMPNATKTMVEVQRAFIDHKAAEYL